MALLYGQNVTDYKYILIPEEFKDAKANKYDLNILLTSKMTAKKFVVIDKTLERNLIENKNSCEIVKAEVSDISTMFTNKVRVVFKDCNDKEISKFEGRSDVKEFDAGMREALTNAMWKMSPSNPIARTTTQVVETVDIVPTKTTAIAAEKVASPVEQNVVLEKVSTNSSPKMIPATKVEAITEKVGTIAKAEVYTNGKLTLNKVLLSNGEFILVNPENSIPYGIFKPSTKKDTYRVQLSDGSSTLGYMENGKIVVEMTSSDGNLSTEVFSKK